jgi:hypothetical protein
MLLRQIYCIVPPLHNIQITVVIYNWLIKRHVSAFFGHHQAYKEIVLIKVHSLAIPMGSAIGDSNNEHYFFVSLMIAEQGRNMSLN